MLKKLFLMVMICVAACSLTVGCGSGGPPAGSAEEDAIRKQTLEKAKQAQAKMKAERGKDK